MIFTGRIGSPYSRITRLAIARPQTVVASVAGWILLDLRSSDLLNLTVEDA